MRKLLKRSISYFLVPLTRWYLRKERKYNYKDIKITVLPGVFHPGLFSSTNFLVEFLEVQDLREQSLLELGCGTGLISIVASKKGAKVLACDLSARAVKNCELNAASTNAKLTIIQSNLFDAINKQVFNWIVINPPYYAKSVQNEEQLAWHCGENFEYFEKLFSSIKGYIHVNTQIIMVLTLGCNLGRIFEIAKTHGYNLDLIREKHVLFDGKDFLYRIRPN